MAAPSFDLTDRIAVVTGGYGVLGGEISAGLADAGARVVILGRRRDAAEAHAASIRAGGGRATVAIADVLDERAVRAARDDVLAEWGRVDVLVNAAGGNVARARNDARSVFDVPLDAHEEALRLNLHGTMVPALVFAEAMTGRRGSIINISSMAALRALSAVLAYSIAKSGVDAFTRWMAVEMARKHGGGLRVNSIAPGFFLSEQNRAVLVNPNGTPTERADAIVRHTPMGRFGRPEELLGAVQWLASDASAFVTGVVLPVDGGFSADGGV
jgi:NAD(P)-dependent dehydrogenase (short-subunit alcohol dehydrogenase family)